MTLYSSGTKQDTSGTGGYRGHLVFRIINEMQAETRKNIKLQTHDAMFDRNVG